ncbi:hypothetical protein EVAR_87160_1 [Eumeta japonica]|uniref:Uncharacterized protein n=1 Tax=Eumeta variegata TaxID=151549 RepID=A0A4C1VWL1_EUMVA|nr:hypothetical protein EVAR_87160_1 [Eumeta japonica]
MASKFENHTAEQVITKVRGVIDAREMGVAVDQIRKARGQKINSDEEIVASLRTQNRHLAEGLVWNKVRARVCYRRRARNNLEYHPVLEVSAELYQRLIKTGFVYGDKFPLVQYSRCLGYGHGKRFCEDVSERCAEHTGLTSRVQKEGEPPKCINCIKAGCEDTVHGVFSSECEVRANWDGMARSKVSYC